MPEQQKVDESIESPSFIDKKKIPMVVEESSTSLEKEQNNSSDTEVEDLKE
jgi:hypothetical protein